MVEQLKDFILNIFFILSPLVFYPYIYKFRDKPVVFRLLLFSLFALVIVIIMRLPFEINGLVYDFRSIPVIIGSLYGGPLVSVLLYVVLVLYRFTLGNPYNLLYAFAVLPSLFIVLFALRRYKTLQVYKKIIVAIVLCSLMKMTVFSFYLAYLNQFHRVFNSIIDTVQTYLVQAVIIGICVYLIEMLNKYYQMQQEVYKSEKIKMVSEMAAAVAHEIRNPLTTVKGFIQLLGESNGDKDKTEFYQKICLEELSRADLIITDYLSLAKADPDMVEKINVNEEISYLSNVLLTYANFNNIHLQTSFAENEELYIIGDRYKFRQALINIGKNAIEAMSDGGTLKLSVNKIGEDVVLSISDTGVGMTPGQIERLGTPYYSTKEKGTGLGTMVSFAIIKKMHGKIDIKSEVGKGTEYKFAFPEAKPGT